MSSWSIDDLAMINPKMYSFYFSLYLNWNNQFRAAGDVGGVVGARKNHFFSHNVYWSIYRHDGEIQLSQSHFTVSPITLSLIRDYSVGASIVFYLVLHLEVVKVVLVLGPTTFPPIQLIVLLMVVNFFISDY